ncbi:hypothetical protein OD781_08915 [Pseudomonas aeruginosa]|nr:hypothetical protein [Pseudomonas aeruginosa]MCV4061254.1 hypothetical protein [Pseudomonas aeruginosa]MCV4077261.1 hypothetical protein [Pseudomonas aeruginosa]MCV4148668.1 hypothetical protein [Pseudomonas aeruginosa]MCV4180529.1 hypothetical protein [Pseudomonas aeruginosa]MCV4219992.1 hypothetical protein [Pseudomonas aeruginosa]
MTIKQCRKTARDFVEKHVAALSADVLIWRKSASLPSESPVHELASLCVPFAADGDQYIEAERLIVQQALEATAASGAAASDTEPHQCSAARNEAAYRRLLPKLVELAEQIDNMSEDEYGNWVDALPKEEFFEYIGVAHNEQTFKSALAAARMLISKPSAVVSAGQ